MPDDDNPTLTREMSDGLEAMRQYVQAAITQRWGPDLGGKLYAVFIARSAVELTCIPAGDGFRDAFNTLAREIGTRVRMTSERAN